MKNYIAEMIDLTGDSYLNPPGAQYGDGSGTHQRAVGRITSISVHHDASLRPHDYDSVARYRQEAGQHYDRLGPGLQYHYKIDNVGQIFRIRPLTTWLYVVGSNENPTTVAICLDGYFHPTVNQVPTREQYEALSQLVVELCSQHPEFPATYPDVRPHSDFSSTACCGDTLRPYVLGIQDEASARAIPANAVYDWPSLQPQPTAPVVDVPSVPTAPIPVDPIQPPKQDPTPARITQDATFKPANYTTQVASHLDGFDTGKHYAEYTPNKPFDFVARFLVDGAGYLVTQYAIDVHNQGKRELAGVPEKDLKLTNVATVPTAPSTDTTPPPVPATPAPTVPEKDQQHDVEKRLGNLEGFQTGILGLLKVIGQAIVEFVTLFGKSK